MKKTGTYRYHLPVTVFLLVLAGLLGTGASPLWGELYFRNTDHQLEVLRISGEKPGLTVLIFGGIHGDEPGGYFSSEILSRIKLDKGRLIIVPRVNYPSIMMNRRQLHGDMNRKFVPQEDPKDPDAAVVKVLKELMAEADVFVNQHDAHGFHRETYINKLYNPTRYGQSIIIDAPRFYSKKLKKEILLAEIGKRIMLRVNRQIKNEKHHFGFWDHNSVSKSTKFTAMRKSATYYALTTHSIPAFGLETSKELPTLSHKVKYQLLMLKEILVEFGLEFSSFPSPRVATPVQYWTEFLKNGTDIIRVNANTNLRLDAGDRLTIKRIFSNYHTGLSADIEGWGSINDVNKDFTFQKNTTIRVKKNHFSIGRIYLRPFRKNSIREILVEINGRARRIPNWGKIEVPEGESFQILGVEPGLPALRVDVRGFQARPGKRDDSNTSISPGQLQAKYSFKKKGEVYFGKIYSRGAFAGGFQVEVVKKEGQNLTSSQPQANP